MITSDSIESGRDIEKHPHVAQGYVPQPSLTTSESLEGIPGKKMADVADYESQDSSEVEPGFVKIYTETMVRMTINGVHYNVDAGESRVRVHVAAMLENIHHPLKRL